jgi:Cu+-exporting ATPase
VLERTPGVEEAAVSLMTNTASVRFDPTVVSAPALVDRIRGTGYGAELPVDERSAVDEQQAQDKARADEVRQLTRKALVSLVAGVVAMIVSMPLMTANAHHGIGPVDPVMRWTMQWLEPVLRVVVPGLYTIP